MEAKSATGMAVAKAMRRIGWAAGLLALLAGCASGGLADRSVSMPTEKESIFILGVSPSHYRVRFFPAEISNGTFDLTAFSIPMVFGLPTDGYLVGKASAGDVLVLYVVQNMDRHPLLPDNPGFYACDGTRAMVFEAPKGKVVYLGDLEFREGSYGQPMQSIYGRDEKAARAYLEKNFPALRGKMEYIHPKFIPSRKEC